MVVDMRIITEFASVFSDGVSPNDDVVASGKRHS
jgi:hypothetical protein